MIVLYRKLCEAPLRLCVEVVLESCGSYFVLLAGLARLWKQRTETYVVLHFKKCRSVPDSRQLRRELQFCLFN